MGSNSNSVSNTLFILPIFFRIWSRNFRLQITVKLNLTHFRLSLYTSGLRCFVLFCFPAFHSPYLREKIRGKN